MDIILIIFSLLLPIAWFFGYRKGKVLSSESDSEQHLGLSRKYFTGLNYLLNEESDKAIDTFVSMLEVDSETVETHLALGNLFRKRGEIDKAIRIHQNLIARPSLSSEHRKQALMSLGYDYMAAGLLERAENIFKELIFDSHHKTSSFKQLLQIYQQTKDWQNAIKIAEQLHQSGHKAYNREIAHFYCELAEIQINDHAYKQATPYLKKAFVIEPQSARATLLSGNIYHVTGQFKQAVRTYKNLIKNDIDILPAALDNILDCFDKLGDHKGLLTFLREAIEQGAGISVILQYATELQSRENDHVAAKYLADTMIKHPSIKGLLELINLHLKHSSESGRPSLLMLKDVVTKLLKNKPVYQCGNCGFSAKTLFWQCPTCKSWGNVKPIRGIEGE
ncbi:MAG: lipopolysaccharide assembly protein LapB [Gammaproteobacteria bacterium]|nr:lipopolysaccharide assembly protein LapB [Gammaproteobacteria bacterium]MDH5629866.1 lipopolysaccharide assembly protein LapB [Gammaproteobacteria bacterium]